jgi:hypothetical protein
MGMRTSSNGARYVPATDEVRQELVAAVGTLGGGREAQRVRREEHLRDDGVLRGGQVVYLVVDHEREPVAVALGVDVGRVVGRDRQRRNLVVAAAEEPDLDRAAEGLRQDRVPLLQEGERRHDDQCAAADALHGSHRHGGLAGAGRQDHDAA